MSEEEKQAIEDIKERVEEYEHYDMATFFTKDVRKLFKIIDKQQKEIEEKSKKYVDLCFEAGKIKADLDIAERVIDKMADYIAKREIEEVNKNSITIKELWNKSSPEKSIYDLVKEYFYKEIEDEQL